MSVGLLRENITLHLPRVTIDEAGFTATALEEVARVRAFVEQRRATRVWVNRAAYTNATILFRLRTIPNLLIDERMVVGWNGGEYRVESVEEFRGRYVDILATRITPQGHTNDRDGLGSGSD